MPCRFRRSIRIAPGVRLNIGKRSVYRFRHSIRLDPGIWLNIGRRGLYSTSFGGHGERVTVGRNTWATASTPRTETAMTHRVVTVVIWGARLLGAAVILALLFSWAAGWLV